MYVSVGVNIGLSPQHGLWQLFSPHPIQLVEIRTQATNKTTAQLLYSHYVGEKLR